MEKQSYLSKSRYLLLFLFALIVGSGTAWADGKALPYSYGFENNNLAGEGWTIAGSSIPTNTAIMSDAKRSDNKGFQFWYNTNPPQYLISPELTTSDATLNLSFWYKNGSTYTETFNVGYSTSNSETGSFTWLEATDITAPSSWTEYTRTLPAGTKYVAIKYTANNQYKLWIDDFCVSEVEAYPKPTAFIFTGYTSTSSTFSWTNGKDETAWQIAYSTTQGFDAGSVTPVDVTTKPYTLTGLTAETTYYARIRADYGSGNYSNWSDEISFKPSATINTTVNDGSQTNTYVPIYGTYLDSGDAKTQFILPSTSLTEVNGRQITGITFYGTESTAGKLGSNTIDIYMSETDNTTISSLADWATLDKVFSGSMTISDGKMVIALDDGFDYSGGNLLVGFKQSGGSTWVTTTWTGVTASGASYGGYSSTLSQQNFLPKMTITSIPQVATVKKPKNFDDSATTTTTATLGWTNGGDETAWQIAYSTDTDFDPDTEGTKVAVDANPYTLTGLTAGTTYYAYIRAKKAEEYSDWSNKADFTTLAAIPVIELSATNHNFGLVSDADAQALTLTITNSGGAALTGLTVTPSAGFAVTDAEGNALTATTIAASSTLTVKVKVSALGQQDGTITIDGNEIDAQQVTVSGYMLDDTKIIETYASLPDNWTQSSTLTYNSTSGVKFPSTARTLTTPKIVVGDGESVVINAKLSYSTGYITITGSTDGTNYNAFDAKTYNNSTGLNTTDYTLVIIDDIPAGTYNLRIQGSDVYVNAFNGFSYAPSLALYNNEECTTSVAAEVDKNFGFITETQQQKYYIKNIGGGQIDLTVNTPTGFTAAIDNAALTANEKATLTITMPNTPEGLHNSSVVVTAKNHADDAVLGTFTVNLNGAVLGLRNDINIVAGELSEMPAGWERGNWSMSASTYVYNSSSTAYDMTSQIFTVAEGETMLIEAKGVNSYNDASLSYSFKVGDADWTEPVAVTGISRSDWKVFELTGASEGLVRIKFTGAYVGIRRFYGFEGASVPVMGFAAEGTTKDFGMITAKTTSDAYTITNTGGAALNGLSVTCNNENFEIAVADNATSIAAGGSVTFTVALKTTALGSQSGTVTIAGTGVESKTLNVKGYVADDSKIFTTFASKPDRWENSGWTFNASTGAYSSSSSYKLTSPKIIVTEGQKLAISGKINSNSTYYYVTIKGSSDNGSTWDAYTNTLTYDVLNKDSYTVVELDDVPTTVNKIQLVGYYVYVNGLNGFAYDENDPEFSLFSDPECNTPIAGTTAANNWGFVDEDKTATYYVKNTGTGTLNLTKTDAPAGMTATLGATSLAANAITSLVISMENDTENNEGYHAGDVVLTGKNSASETLGTFTVTSSGVVVGSKTDINFTTLSAFPAGWEADGWSVTANTKATTSSSSKMLTTGTYTVAAGEKLVIEGRGNSSWSSPSLTYRYSTDGGSSWTAGTSTLSYTYSASDYKLQVIDDIPAGNAKIEFTGSYMDIRRIYGYTAVLEPVMTLSPAAADYDFDMQTAAANYEIIVTNSGTAEMTTVVAALTGDDAADYQVALSVPDGSSATISENLATIPVGQTLKVTATLKASAEYKTHNATLTISADGLADKVITLTGKTRDADKWYVDFASEIPSNFVEKGSWTVSSGAAYSGSSSETSLITQPINLAAGEKIYFDAKKPSYGSPSLKVRYSVNGGISWSDYVDYSAAISSTSAYSSHEIDLENASAVTAIVEFKGYYYMYIDNVYGGTLNNTASMIKVTKSAAIVENGATEAFGPISGETTATYTITNVGNGTLTITSPVTTTGVATAAVNATSLANGESATLTITMPVAAPYEYKEGVVTVVTSLGDFVINYNATILNPNALDEQFASGKPAGWYFGGYWEVNSQRAENTASGVADLITEQLSVAGTSDVLTFQAAKTGSSAETFMVYTSQDRITWNEVDLSSLTLTTSYQDVNISGLAAGDYYVKISGARVKVDNFLGWEKKNNTHDLYVTATSFPATTTKGNSATISATVTSLIADETGVYAKLFIDGVQEGDASAAQDIALNGTKTFSFTYAIPENKTAQIKVYYSNDTEAFATAVNNMKVNYTLSQTSSEAIETGTYNVTLQRTYIDGWNTICLPFAMNSSAISEKFGAEAKVFAFDSYSDVSGLHFETVSAMDAGKPYLIYIPSVVSLGNLTFNDTEITEATAGSVEQTVTFQGTYSPKAAGTLTGKHVLNTSGKLAKATASASMKGFRAYFDAPASARMLISIDGETTGIASITVDGELQMESVYNLNGQKVQNAKKGLYIVNGKKVVIK